MPAIKIIRRSKSSCLQTPDKMNNLKAVFILVVLAILWHSGNSFSSAHAINHAVQHSSLAAVADTQSGSLGELVYFDFPGAAEMSRILLHVGGIQYDDIRYPITKKPTGGFETLEFNAAKSSGELAANMDRVPILITSSGVKIGQSKAIERFIARKCSMMGSSDEEYAVIDCIAEHTRDIKEKFGKVKMTGGFGPNPEKDAALKKWYAEEMPVWLEKLEKSLVALRSAIASSSPYCVGGKLSYADINIWHLVFDQFDDKDAVDKALSTCPTLAEIASNVGKLESLKAYISNRPKAAF